MVVIETAYDPGRIHVYLSYQGAPTWREVLTPGDINFRPLIVFDDGGIYIDLAAGTMRISDDLIDWHLSDDPEVDRYDISGVGLSAGEARATRSSQSGRVVAAAILVSVLIACSNSGEQATTTTSGSPATTATPTTLAAPQLMLTDGGCEAMPSTVASGFVTVTVRNDSGSLASFQVVQLRGSFDDFVALVDELNDASETDFGFDALDAEIIKEGERILVEAGATGQIVVRTTAGTYGAYCVVLDGNEDAVTVWPAGPYEVAA
jgi:uncharacterized cupredoxin-like copper-binding protein